MSTDGLHRCAVPDCPKRIVREFLMCRAHWRQLPTLLRKRIWQLYVSGQEDDLSLVSAEYLEALQQALAIFPAPGVSA